MDHMDRVLTSQSIDRTFEAPIRAALAMGKKTLNRYYTLTDASETYRISMSKCSILLLNPLMICATFASSPS